MKSFFVLLLVFSFCFSFLAKAEEKVFAGWILHMFLSGQLKEYTPRGGMSECLKVKRKIKRSNKSETGVRWECKQGKLVLRKFSEDRWLPVKHLGNN